MMGSTEVHLPETPQKPEGHLLGPVITENFRTIFNDFWFDVILWRPEIGLPAEAEKQPFVALDTETEPLVSGCPVAPVLLQTCWLKLRIVELVSYWDMAEYLRQLGETCPDIVPVFLNAPFDLHVLRWQENFLAKCVREQRYVDVGIRFALKGIHDGTFSEKWNLELAAKSVLSVDLPKDPEVRLSYRQALPLRKRQASYAAHDPIATALLYHKMPREYPTEKITQKGHIALHYMSLNGMMVDKDALLKAKQEHMKKEEQLYDYLTLWGYHPKQGTDRASLPGNKARLQQILHAIERDYKLTFSRTEKTKEIRCSEKDAMRMFLDQPIPLFLETLFRYNHIHKMLSTYLNEDLIGEDGRVHPYFAPLVKTGRTSCSKPNLQNPPRKGGIRELHIAPPGCVLCASDYSQIELCSLAQYCYKRFGRSMLLDLINSGVDVHYWLGDKLMVIFGETQTTDEIRKVYRQRAKAGNFGFPGGLGATNFRIYAMGFGVQLTQEEAEKCRDAWFEALPEMKLFLQGDEDEIWTSKKVQLYVNEHGLPANIKTLGELERELRERGKSDDEIWKIGHSLIMYKSETLTGRVKHNCTFCASANMKFQGTTADGAKLALFELFMRGFKCVNFIHDEVIDELVDRPELFTPHIEMKEQIMITEMQKVLPDVRLSIDTALMYRWTKEAEKIMDENGNWVIWTPENAEKHLKGAK